MRLPICCLCSSTRATIGRVCTGCAYLYLTRRPLIIRRSVRAVA